MTNVTFAVSDSMYKQMKSHPEIKWSEITRQSIRQYLRRFENDKDWRDHSKRIALKDWDEARDLFEF